LSESAPWKRAALWLLLLGPFFFASYGFANWITGLRGDVGTVAFDWERHIPFLAWTIVPYWAIDLLYALSLFICTTRRELDTHAKRLLAVQILSVTGFLLFPLRCTLARPDTGGVFGWMFHVLTGFDKPFNQAPSLHIGLLMILWSRYAAHFPKAWRWVLHGSFLLIGASVLTTYQHHFIDVPTGLWVGLVVLAALPMERPEARVPRAAVTRRHRMLAASYGLGAAALAVLARVTGGLGWLLLWPAGAFLLVAATYLAADARLFGKVGGRIRASSLWPLAPYLAGAWLNSRWWTRRSPGPNEIVDGVWLGRVPSRTERDAAPVASLVDVTAEMPVDATGARYRCVPMLDLVLPAPRQLDEAAEAIESLSEQRPTLVFCALGYSRSALAVAAWLLATGRASSAGEAVAMISERRPGVVLSAAHLARLSEWDRRVEQ
jgi:protein-tyrosine phosphatase/membrane-associated phospholipid phosphatase